MDVTYSEVVTLISQLSMLGPAIILFRRYQSTKVELNLWFFMVFSTLFINGLFEILRSLVIHNKIEQTDFVFYLFAVKYAIICFHALLICFIAFRWILDDSSLRPLYIFFATVLISILFFLYAFYQFTFGTLNPTLEVYLYSAYRDQFKDGYYIIAILDFFVGIFRLSMLGFLTLLIVAYRINLDNQPKDVKDGFRYFRIVLFLFLGYNLLGFLRSEELIEADALSENGWEQYWNVQITLTFIGNLTVFLLLLRFPNMLIATQATSERVINTYKKLGLTEMRNEEVSPNITQVLDYLQRARKLSTIAQEQV